MPGEEIRRLSRVRLPGDSSLVDVDVVDGVVTDVRPNSGALDSHEVGEWSDGVSSVIVEDLGGQLLLPSLQEHHAHLDKVLTADTVRNLSGDLMGAIRAWIAAEESGVFDVEEMQRRAETAIEQFALAGTTRIRTHVNIGASDPTFRNLRAVRAARDAFAAHVDIDIVALMHSPLAGRDGEENRRALDRAVEIGVDFIGGCPHLEADGQGVIDHVLSVGNDAGLGVDLHVDETLDPEMTTVDLLCRTILERGFRFPVTASHCVSLAVQSLERQEEIISRIAEAGVRVVALPQTNLYLQGRDHPQSMPRAITPVQLLLERGANVVAGGDNVQDPFNPMGRNDPLEAASLLVLASHIDPLQAFGAVATSPIDRFARGRELIGLAADFVAVSDANVREALATASPARTTIRKGAVIARSTLDRRLTISRT